MRIILISTTIYALPPKGYSGTEALTYVLAREYQKAGHQVAVVAPESSQLPEGIELIAVPLRCTEEAAYEMYKTRLPEFDIVHDHSLSGETPLLVQLFGRWEKLSFSSLFARLAQSLPVRRIGLSEVIDLQPGVLRVHTYYQRVFTTHVSQISRHSAESLYHVQATRGLSVLATEGHGLFTEVRRTKFASRPVAASQTLGRRLITAKHLACEIADTDYLPMDLPRFDGYIRGAAVEKRLEESAKELIGVLVTDGESLASARSKVSRWKRYSYMPATMASATGNHLTGQIYTHHGDSIDFPVPLSPILLRFFGLWLGDGNYDSNGVDLSAGTCPEVQAIVETVSSIFNGSWSRGSLRPDVKFRITSALLKKVMGAAGFNGHATTKMFPTWVFNLSDAQVGCLLAGLFEADGCVNDKEIILALTNLSLIEDTRFLLWRLGIDSQLSRVPSKVTNLLTVQGKEIHSKPAYRLVVPQRDFAIYAKKVGFLTTARTKRLSVNTKPSIPGRRSQIRGALVKSVEKMRVADWVYDLTVPKYERFFAGGILAHNTFGSWPYLSSIGVDPPLPIIKTFHTDPSIWSSPPPVQHPCLVGISRNHARRLALHLGVTCEYQYNGIDLNFYKPPPEGSKRNGRLLFIGRYTPEKGAIEAMTLAKRLRMPLDCYGDIEVVANPEYVDRCRREADGVLVRFFTGVSREKTVELYQTYRALLFPLNWVEPFGLVPVEAQSSGMPVLTLERGSMPEVVKHGVTGYVCQDIQELEQVLKEGCLSKIKPEDCVAWASQFSIENMTAGYLRLFERMKQGNLW